mmetsp:Transcript_382/g.712  ORF Transcript_382/g.712 Transcript_382/m.712 type:complete len:566 (+) Transcript_382:65-1762(+)|eukprot:scaffold22432_cov168-Amphora_coffeaeformis.AAC.24
MKIVIIGGVAGGASAAARARRLDEKAEIIVLQAGPDVSFASCGMPYFIGGEITDRATMAVQTPESLKARLNLDVRVNTTVTKIDTANQLVVCNNTAGGDTYEEMYDRLILAVGAAPLKPPIPGIDRPGLFSLRNLQDMDAITAWLDKKKAQYPKNMHCVVAGAGFIGLEMVEQLVARGYDVSLVELQKQILGPLDEEMAAYLHRDLEERGVNVIVNDAITEFAQAPGDDPELTQVHLRSGKSIEPAQLTILGLGVRPDSDMVKAAGIECTPRGHIIVDDELRTSAKNVWAVGDSVQVKNPILPGEMWAVPLAGPANRQGRMAADNIYGKGRKFKGTYATSLVRSFDIYAACVGLNEKFLMSKNIPYGCIHIHSNSHAGYYPGASPVRLKVIFDKDSGKIYGAQGVGLDGVDKRIDVIATAMQGNLLVTDLAELELCYAPPIGAAKDPVNMAGMAAQNIMDGLVAQIEWHDLEKYVRDANTIVLDVRNPAEIAKGKLTDSAVNIPVNDLRQRMSELPKDKHYIVTCASGQRAYYACRILTQNGYDDVSSLGGAYATFHAIHPKELR